VKCYQIIRLLGLMTLYRVVSRRRFEGRWCSYLRCNFTLQLDGGSRFLQTSLSTHKPKKCQKLRIPSSDQYLSWKPDNPTWSWCEHYLKVRARYTHFPTLLLPHWTYKRRVS